MRNRQLADKIKIVNAIIPTSGAIGAGTATVVDGTGFGRVAFVLSTGAAAAGATIAYKVQSSATSGGSYADVASAALSSVTAAAGASKQNVIDMPVDSVKPFMKLVQTVGTDTFANSSLAILYRSTNYPIDTAYATQIVTL